MAGGLDEYRSKRDFGRTAEPRGAARASRKKAAAPSFVIQKHAARRLHYDLRLELDGVYKSWAVTKGPSLVPGEKRLSVAVEDHPLDYGSFEGTIPQGEYGGGSVLLWDSGTWTPDGDPHRGLEKGHLEFTLAGEKLHGRWHLVRLKPRRGEKKTNWLLIKAEDDFARTADAPDILDEAPRSVKTGRLVEEIAEGTDKVWTKEGEADPPPPEKKRAVAGKARRTGSKALPAFVEPCLATLVEATPADPKFIHEIKFDGYRLQAAIADGRVVTRTRAGHDWTEKFEGAPFLDALRRLPGTLLIDGELVVNAETGHSDFTALQDDLSTGRRERMVYMAFDLLQRDGTDLRGEPLTERKAALEPLIAALDDPAVRFSEHLEESGETLLDHACRLGLEGIVSKRKDAPYRSGRGKDWVKSKCTARQEFVVAGFTPSTTLKRAVGALVLGYYDGETLIHAGRVGSGFTEDSARTMFALLDAERRETSPFAAKLVTADARQVRFVEPKRVAEVEFRGWTGGGSLRHPVFKGLREDKAAEDVRREDTGRDRKAAPRHSIALTHPDRLLWPDAGVTKQGLAEFYADIWDWIRPHVTGRLLSLVRCPEGIAGSCFFQKHAWRGLSDAVEQVHLPGDPEEQLAIADLDGLIALVQAGVLEIHPWGSRLDDVERPDMLTFDLDPGEGVDWDGVVAGALAVRDRLGEDGLETFVKTSGGKGLHVVVPITPEADWDTAKAYCRGVAEDLAERMPERYTAALAKKARGGRIFIDYLRNGRGATAVAAFSTRARPGAPVATPVGWKELGPALRPDRFRIGNLAARLDHLGSDPWAKFFTTRQTLPAGEPKPKKGKPKGKPSGRSPRRG